MQVGFNVFSANQEKAAFQSQYEMAKSLREQVNC